MNTATSFYQGKNGLVIIQHDFPTNADLEWLQEKHSRLDSSRLFLIGSPCPHLPDGTPLPPFEDTVFLAWRSCFSN